jgi:hypothetical protein
MTGEELLVHVAHVAAHRFGLVVWQWLPGPCSGHAPDSLHYQRFRAAPHRGRAFDAYRSSLRQARYARWLRRTHKHRLTECIYNGRFTKVSIHQGHDVPPSFWGSATWTAHRNHVHVGI